MFNSVENSEQVLNKIIDSEKPAHLMMLSLQEEFIRARESELILLISESTSEYEKKDLLYNWISFCEPYGFEYLGNLAKKLLAAHEKKIHDDFEQTIDIMKKYLSLKKLRISAHNNSTS